MRRNTVFVVVTVWLLTSVGAANATELSGTPEELTRYLQTGTRTVTLHDEATEKAYTDIAIVKLVVTTQARALALSMRENNELREAIRKELVALGVAADKIQSSKYSASPQYGWFGRKPASFTVVNSLVVTVDSDALFRGVAAVADSREEVAFAGVEFEHSEKEGSEQIVRDKALQAVMQNKDYFAKELGLVLTPVQFSFSDVYADSPGRYAAVEEMVVTARRMESKGVSASAPVAVPSFNEVTYRASVSVTFAISAGE